MNDSWKPGRFVAGQTFRPMFGNGLEAADYHREFGHEPPSHWLPYTGQPSFGTRAEAEAFARSVGGRGTASLAEHGGGWSYTEVRPLPA